MPMTNLATPPPTIRRVAFLGSPVEAAVALRALVEAGFEVTHVISQPDRKRRRGSALVPTPVKQTALELGLPVGDDLVDLDEPIGAGAIDLGVVVAYGRIIPPSVLARLAMVNIHFSLLPRWRGAAPVERAILAGDTETGVTLMEVAEGLDEGGVYAVEKVSIDPDESAVELRGRLATIGAGLLVERLASGLGPAVPQTGEVTYAPKLERSEARLDFTGPALELHRRIRVGRAWAEFRGRRLVIESARLAAPGMSSDAATAAPGELRGATVATGDGWLELVTVIPEGKRPMSGLDWVNGVQPAAGEQLV